MTTLAEVVVGLLIAVAIMRWVWRASDPEPLRFLPLVLQSAALDLAEREHENLSPEFIALACEAGELRHPVDCPACYPLLAKDRAGRYLAGGPIASRMARQEQEIQRLAEEWRA